MSSNLRVNNILPSVGTNVSIGTAGGSITLTGSTTGDITSSGVSTFTTLRATSIVGVSTIGVTTAYINTLSGISTISASAAIGINQNLVFASGKGIDFSAAAGSAAASTSALLNDYEEGTWTPYWSNSSGTNLFVNNDVSNQNSYYRKINNMVFYSTYFYSDGSFSYNTGINGSTPAYIGGLPFVVGGYHAGSVGYYISWTGYDSSGYGFTPMIISESGQSTLRLQYPNTNGVSNIGASSLLSASSAIIVSGLYFTS